jgi:DNA modification methylase
MLYSEPLEKNKIYQGDCKEVMKTFPDESIQCCVTSPPYWGLRDYGTATWDGGDSDCDHIDSEKLAERNRQKKSMIAVGERIDGSTRTRVHDETIGKEWQYKQTCKKCGAIRIDSQLGLEKTPEEYIEKMVDVFREVKRVLKKDGTCWINIGDSYWGGKGKSNYAFQEKRTSESIEGNQHNITGMGETRPQDGKHDVIKPKDLVGIPWMLAFALRADGWYLRQDIIWHKPNPMPESVTDRCTKSHEYIFLLSKSQQYYYDNEAIKEPLAGSSIVRLSQNIESQEGSTRVPGKTNGNMKAIRPNGISRDRLLNYNSKEKILRPNTKRGGVEKESDLPEPSMLRNKRSVWTITTKPFKKAHFATFPKKLIDPCILAGCPKGGIVLDPFIGAGTVGLVAVENNRNYIGCELNPEYIKIAERRILNAQPQLF